MYSPRLNAQELDSASYALAQAARNARTRATDVGDVPRVLTQIGFAGQAAAAVMSQFPTWKMRLLTSAALMQHASDIMSSSAAAQQKIDSLAYVAANLGRADAIYYLNLMAQALDSYTAHQLRALMSGPQPPSTLLIDAPTESLESIDARLSPTLPATIRDTVRAAGGLVLETGPGGTTVMVGAEPGMMDPERITTMVAGVSTGRPEQLAGELEKAHIISAATQGPVVVWQGYSPPPSVVHGIDPSAARFGGAALTDFQAALQQRFPHAQQTVVAHSYGTVVAARAARDSGLDVDDLWLLDSPGVPASGFNEFDLRSDSSEVFVVDADRDPIIATRLNTRAIHGHSPAAESFGATRIRGVRGNHSAYFTDPTFLHALAQAAR